MNGAAKRSGGTAVLGEIARACTRVLAAFCVLEAALPRAGRAAAGLLLRTDSGILRWIESTGARIQVFSANGILFGALAAILATVLCRIRHVPNAARVALFGILLLGGWVFLRRSSGGAFELWLAAAAGPALAMAALLLTQRSLTASCAAMLQAGILAYAAWALLVTSGSPARPGIDQSSEVLILAGIAGAGITSSRRGARFRLMLAAVAFAGTCLVALMFREASHAVVRHLATVGNSGLSFQVTAPLLAAAVAGLVVATGRPGLFAPLVVALVCARRPEPYLILGTLASAALLASMDGGSPTKEG